MTFCYTSYNFEYHFDKKKRIIKLVSVKAVFFYKGGINATMDSEQGSLGHIAGSSLGFQNCGCIFSYVLKKLKIEDIFVQKIRVKNKICSKSVCAKSVFLKICGCSCAHCIHTNEVPIIYKKKRKKERIWAN